MHIRKKKGRAKFEHSQTFLIPSIFNRIEIENKYIYCIFTDVLHMSCAIAPGIKTLHSNLREKGVPCVWLRAGQFLHSTST